MLVTRENVLFADLNNHVSVSSIDGVYCDPEEIEPIANLIFDCFNKLGF